jgi:hypothetical protein
VAVCFEPETISTMSAAFERACAAMGLRHDSDDQATGLVAEKIMQLVQRGVEDAEHLLSLAIQELTGRE